MSALDANPLIVTAGGAATDGTSWAMSFSVTVTGLSLIVAIGAQNVSS